MLALLRAWKVTLVAFFLAIAGGLVIAVPFFWLMPRLYLPLQPTYYGVAIVYDDTYPASKVDQARDAVANLYTKDCLIRDRRKWATTPTKLSDMRLVPFLTWQVGVAYGFEPYKCDVGYKPPQTFAEKVTLGVTTGPLVVLELFIRALWGWFLPLLAGQVVFYKWRHEMIWEAHF